MKTSLSLSLVVASACLAGGGCAKPAAETTKADKPTAEKSTTDEAAAAASESKSTDEAAESTTSEAARPEARPDTTNVNAQAVGPRPAAAMVQRTATAVKTTHRAQSAAIPRVVSAGNAGGNGAVAKPAVDAERSAAAATAGGSRVSPAAPMGSATGRIDHAARMATPESDG